MPKLIAAAIIGKHPERYGFTGIEFQEELRYDTVDVEGSVSVDVLAKLADLTVEEIEALNPALVRGATPPDGTTHVRVPLETGEVFAARLEELPPEERVTYRRHRVAKGESLGRIASRYGVTTASLAQFNKIANPNRIYVGMDLIIPVPGATPPPEAIAAASGSGSSSVKSKPAPAAASVKHTVARGETLSGIAARYGVKPSAVQSANGLRDADQIKVGQVLTVVGGQPAAQLQTSYTVRRGDSLGKIAERFGCSVSDLQSWNGIRDASSIRAGQKLKLYPKSGGWTTYTVQSGDSLGRIAKRYSCSVTDLKSWNDLNSSTIHPGQKLKIRRS